MGILVITWNFPPRRGGMESLLNGLVSGIRKRYEVLVITGYARSLESAERDVFRAPCPGLVPFGFYALWQGAWLLFKNPRINVIFGGSVLATPLVLILARLFNRKAVVQAHGLDVVYPGLGYRWLCAHWLRFCDRIVVNSAFTASLVRQSHASRNHMVIIPPGVHWKRFAGPIDVEATKKQFDLEGKRIILFVGRLAKRKGVREFIESSLASIVKAVPDACFVVVGENPTDSLTHRGDVLGEVKSVITDLRLQRHVRLLGNLEDGEVDRLYRACDVVVLPVLPIAGDVEGFGIVLLEAGAAAKPVVATRVGGVPDAVENGKSGIMVDPGDYVGMSQDIITLLTHEEKRLAMGAYAQRRVQERFDWKRVIAEYEAAFEA